MSSPESLPQNPLQGMLIMSGAMLVLPVMDAIAKYMATFDGMSPGQVTFYRFFFQLVVTLPLVFGLSLGLMRPGKGLMTALQYRSVEGSR